MKRNIFNSVVVISLLLSCHCSLKEEQKAKGLYGMVKTSEVDEILLKDSLLEISYIGNMGVILESGEKTILFDGFHEKYKAAYKYPSSDIVERLISGNYKDYTEIEISLVTHKHKDHFSPSLNKKFLKENRESILMGSKQITELIEEELEEIESSIIDQLHEIEYNYTIDEKEHKGIKVKSIRCDHSNEKRHNKIENIAYLAYLDNYSVLHVGDTYWNFGEEVFKKLNLLNEKLDIAILPYWMLSESSSKELVLKFINPQKIIASHIPPKYNIKDQEWLKKEYSNIVLLIEPDEKTEYKKPSTKRD